MWVFTQRGFVAVVRSGDQVWAGALDRLSLENLEVRADQDMRAGWPSDRFNGKFPYVVSVSLRDFDEWLEEELQPLNVGDALMLFRGETYKQVIANVWEAAQPIRGMDEDA